MPNRYDEALRIELRQRYLRLYKSSAADLQKQMRYFREWAAKHQAIELLFQELEGADPAFDPSVWIQEQLSASRRGDYELPDTEDNLARVGWTMVNKLADDELSTRELLGFSYERNFNDAAREVVEAIIEPMFDYVESRLSFGDELLHVLARYRDRVAWFDRASLLEQYEADTARGEAILDADLRRFVFEQGYDFPFAQPRGPSGDVDVLADLGDDPLPCEVKLFDGQTKSLARIASGVTQARRYATDYGRTVAYLVVFNLGAKPLELPSDDPEGRWPPRVDVAGVSVFIVVIDLAKRPSASKEGRTGALVVRRDQLIEDG